MALRLSVFNDRMGDAIARHDAAEGALADQEPAFLEMHLQAVPPGAFDEMDIAAELAIFDPVTQPDDRLEQSRFGRKCVSPSPTPNGRKRRTLRIASTPPRVPHIRQKRETAIGSEFGTRVAMAIATTLAIVTPIPNLRTCGVEATVVCIPGS